MTQKSFRTLTDLINTDYYDFAMYSLKKRAIPSMIDGLKPSTRKILFTAIKHARSKVKTIALLGYVIANGYHHGDASLADAINLMVAEHSNNAPLLTGEGNFGNRFEKSASAPRYTSVKLSGAFDLYFKDTEIAPEDVDPEILEPQFFLPLVPWVLVNGVSGIAVGYACEIQPRNPKDLVKAIQKIVTGKPVSDSDIKPWFASFQGLIRKNDTGYEQVGLYSRGLKNRLLITEIPSKFDRETYVKHLDKLEADGRIESYKEECSKGGFRFDVKMKKVPDEAGIEKLFRLVDNLSENITVIDEEGKLRIYKSAIELLQDFVKFRLGYYTKRYAAFISRDEEKARFLAEKLRFIGLVVNNQVDVKKTREQLSQSLIAAKFSGDDVRRLLDIPFYSFCTDEIKKIEQQILDLKNAISTWKSTDINDAYIEDLRVIK